MFQDMNIDKLLKEYYYAIDSNKLSDSNINIDDNLQVENSLAKYIEVFANFLNESYCRGYIISEPIFKKLMDIVDYEGYEFQIINQYVDILLSNMKDTIYCHNKINKILDIKDYTEYINKYLEFIKKDIILDDKTYLKVPCLTNISEDLNSFKINVLQEIDYPIDYIYKNIKNNNLINKKSDMYVFSMYVIYKNNINAYHSLVDKNNKEGFFFLINETDNYSLDILIENLNSLSELSKLLEIYYRYYENITYNIDINIRRLIELLTINITIDQVAMIIGKDYNIWKKFSNSRLTNLFTLENALSLYEENNEKYHIVTPIEYLNNIHSLYPEDAYFYARNILLSMNYDLFCNNFDYINDKLITLVGEDAAIEILSECINGLSLIHNQEVDDKLVEVFELLKEGINDKLYESIKTTK